MIVFGLEAGRRAAELARELDLPAAPDAAFAAEEQRRLDRWFAAHPHPVTVTRAQEELQQIMQEHVFLVRSEAGLLKAQDAIRGLREEMLPRVHVSGSRRYNLDWARAVDLECTLESAVVVVQAALARKESRGFHWRQEHPGAVDRLPRHTVAHYRDRRPQVGMAPVIMSRRVPGGEA